MAMQHAAPWQPVDIAPLGERLRERASHAILKTHALELIRLVLQAGQQMPPHAVYGEITLHCLEGEVEVEGEGGACRLGPGQLVLLPAQDRHGLRALRDSSLLLTVQTPAGLPGSGSSTG